VNPHSVLVVDDDYYALEAIQLLLSRDARTRVWGAAHSPQGAVELLSAEAGGSERPGPDVILLDVRFGGDEQAGLDHLPEIAKTGLGAKVLVTSVLQDESVVRRAITNGADGFVWKNESGNGIASAIVGVAEGRFVMTPSIARLILGGAEDLRAYATEVLGLEPERAELTSTLKKTLYLFCMCGLSVREIADELQVSPNTVSSRIKIAYQALGAGSRQEAFARLVERERAGGSHA
jgi:DNA-binding NarL/FixJ family response regulator